MMKIISLVFFAVFFSLVVFSGYGDDGEYRDVFAEEERVRFTAPISNTFVVMTDHVRYDVPHHVTNGTVGSIKPQCESSSLVVQINPDGNGELILEIPRELLDIGSGGSNRGEEGNDFFVLLDSEEIKFE